MENILLCYTKGMNKTSSDYPVVGRNSEINLDKYLVSVHGREIIDYEKLKQEEPDLYSRILEEERKSNIDPDLV